MKLLFSLGALALLLGNSPLSAQPAVESVAAPLAPPINWQILRGADKKPLARRAAGDLEVELRVGAWCRVKQFDSPQFRSQISLSHFDHGFAGFALQPRLFDREGKPVDHKNIGRGIITLDNGEKGYSFWRGDENGGLYFQGLNPYAKKGSVELEIADPKRPPEAEGRFPREVSFDNLPYPTQANTFIPLNRTYRSPLGSQIVLQGLARYEVGLSRSSNPKDLAPAGIYCFFRQIKPDATKDMDFGMVDLKIAALEGDKATELTFRTGASSDLRDEKTRGSFFSSGYWTYIYDAPAKPRPLRFKISYQESSPSWKQLQYFPTVSFPLDFTGFLMPPRDETARPLAIAQNEDVEVAFDLWQDRSYREVERRYLAWFWTRDRKIRDDPSLRWIVAGGSARPGSWSSASQIEAQLSDGGTVYLTGSYSTDSGSSWRFRPDATPVLGSEFRPAVTFSADALQGQPQKWDMKVSFAQWRLKKHDWNWKRVPLPRAGEKLTLNREAISPTGTRVHLVSAAFYDAQHHFASIFNWSELSADATPDSGPTWGKRSSTLFPAKKAAPKSRVGRSFIRSSNLCRVRST